MDTKTLFTNLADSAVEFLNESVHELEKSPQRSLISFATAIELFLKARLLCEHWALVYEKPQNAKYDDFIEGKFVSVGLRECVSRLANICKVRIGEKELDSFDKIQEHRNKLIHFFHPHLNANAHAALREGVLQAELRGWFHLSRILARSEFEPFFTDQSDKISEIERQMRRNQRFLEEKYKAVKPEVEAGNQSGSPAHKCPICRFDATVIKRNTLPLLQFKCEVCEWTTSTIQTECPKCKCLISTDCGEGYCEDCDTSVNLEDLLDKYGVSQTQEEAMLDDAHAYCSECQHHEASVVPFEDEWLCLFCATLHNTTETCGYCGSFVTGDLEMSSLTGCSKCEGPDYKD